MVNIFIEGKDSKVPEYGFLTAIIKNIGIQDDKYKIIPVDGYKNLLSSKNSGTNISLMRANVDEGGKNLVIFDADFPGNSGGFAARRDELISNRDSIGIDFELFLWPDNKSDGDVECLMEQIARRDLYPEFFICFSRYECCISKRKKENGEQFYSTPNRKGKLHTYYNSLPISSRKKSKSGGGDWGWNIPEIWNFDAMELQPIKDFLSEHING